MAIQRALLPNIEISYHTYRSAITAGLLDQELAFGLPTRLIKFVADLKTKLSGWVDKLQVNMVDVTKALLSKDVYKLLVKIGFNLNKLLGWLNKALSLVKNGLVKVFEKMEKEGWLDKLKSGTAKIDDLLNSYPLLKKLSGPVVAGLLFFVWMKMSFTGSFSYDFDFSQILDAMAGTYSLTELFATPEGLAAMTLLVTGILSAGALSFPWLADDIGKIVLALVYTGAKKAKIKDLALKTHQAIQHKLEVAKSVISSVACLHSILEEKKYESKGYKRLAKLHQRRSGTDYPI